MSNLESVINGYLARNPIGKGSGKSEGEDEGKNADNDKTEDVETKAKLDRLNQQISMAEARLSDPKLTPESKTILITHLQLMAALLPPSCCTRINELLERYSSQPPPPPPPPDKK